MEILDVGTLNAQMDQEDQEIMKMFSNKKMSGVNDMYMVQNKNSTYLVRKSAINHFDRVVRFTAVLSNIAIAVASILCSITSFITHIGNPWVGLIIFELCLLPGEVKFIHKLLREV